MNGILTNVIGNAAMAVLVSASVIFFLIPIPALLLDIIIAFNLIIALLILLIVLYNKKAAEFSLFPTVFLVSSIFGLAAGIFAARLILTKGADFDGRLIRFVSDLITGSDDTTGLAVGFMAFIAITAVHVMVVLKGATRISEAAARFVLDALPGKQMLIDTEYTSGAIDQKEAFLRKEALQRETDFYGAMDGASKFVSGIEKIRLFIIIITIIAGIQIGTIFLGETIIDAIKIYIALAVGNGVLSMLPAFFISSASGIIITRSVEGD